MTVTREKACLFLLKKKSSSIERRISDHLVANTINFIALLMQIYLNCMCGCVRARAQTQCIYYLFYCQAAEATAKVVGTASAPHVEIYL
jgi:hypothetical protein